MIACGKDNIGRLDRFLGASHSRVGWSFTWRIPRGVMLLADRRPAAKAAARRSKVPLLSYKDMFMDVRL
jgi:hypothetical protein